MSKKKKAKLYAWYNSITDQISVFNLETTTMLANYIIRDEGKFFRTFIFLGEI